MPSPVGHALGGLVAAFAVDALARRPRLTLPLLAASAALAVAPDLDILTGSHRTYSHSAGAVVIVAATCWLVRRARYGSAAGTAVLTAAYASHLFFDWLSKDTAQPSGLMALWPFTTRYYESGLDLFGEISRRYWLPQEFIIGNIKAALWELAVLGSLLLVTWAVWSRQTLKTNN
jgi:membrane-bound metal-dependent hydrolase YbcI (DUF457 family)